MTDKTDSIEDVDANAGGDPQDSVEELKSTIARLEAEAAKNRNLAKKAFADRDDAKAKAKNPAADENFKALYEEAQGEKTALLNRAKTADVKSALTAQFAKTGLLPDAMALATKAIDMDLIDWDLDSGVDSTTITAAVAKVKRENAFLFEKAISRTDPKSPADGKAQDANVMTRSEFDLLNGYAKAAFMKKGTLKD